MSFENKSTEELEALGREWETKDPTEEELIELSPQVTQTEDEGVFEVEVTDDPNVSLDNSAPNPTDTKDNQQQTQQTTTIPVETPKPALTDETYNSLIQQHPQLAKFKNDENFLTNLSQSYVNLESKIGEPKKPEPTLPPITDEQRIAQLNKQILTETERRMLADSLIIEALTVRDENGQVTEMLPFPRTPADIAKFKRDYPAEYIDFKTRGEKLYDTVHKEINDSAKMQAYAPNYNMGQVDALISQVGEYYKKIAPTATQDDMKTVGDKLNEFLSVNLKDAKYYAKRGNTAFLQGQLLFGDFLGQNPELTSRMAELNAKNGSSKMSQDTIRQVQQKTSMKTLASNGISSGERRKVNLLDPKVMDNLSTKQLIDLESSLT